MNLTIGLVVSSDHERRYWQREIVTEFTEWVHKCCQFIRDDVDMHGRQYDIIVMTGQASKYLQDRAKARLKKNGVLLERLEGLDHLGKEIEKRVKC